jgi:hypothetical protein
MQGKLATDKIEEEDDAIKDVDKDKPEAPKDTQNDQ